MELREAQTVEVMHRHHPAPLPLGKDDALVRVKQVHRPQKRLHRRAAPAPRNHRSEGREQEFGNRRTSTSGMAGNLTLGGETRPHGLKVLRNGSE